MRFPLRWLIPVILFGHFGLAGAGVLPDCSRPLSLALHDHGLLYSADTDSGIDKDVANELIRRSGCRITLSVLPRARIWQLIESGALDFSLSGISNPEREKFAAFAWYFTNPYYLLVRQDAKVGKLADFLGNAKLQLGVIRSFRYGTSANRFVDTLYADGRVSFASGLAPLYETLALGRIHGMIIEPFDYPALDQRAIRATTTILEFPDPPVPHGLIMSRKAIAPEEQAKWRALVDAMRADGTMLRIFEKYFHPDQARQLVHGLTSG